MLAALFPHVASAEDCSTITLPSGSVCQNVGTGPDCSWGDGFVDENGVLHEQYICTGGSSGGSSGGSDNGKYPGLTEKTDAVLNFDCDPADPDLLIDYQNCPDYQKYTGQRDEGWHTFDIPTSKPVATKYDFEGWAEYPSDYDPDTDPTPETPEIDQIYPSGSQISVALGDSVTLHAIWKKARPRLIYMANTGNSEKPIKRAGDIGQTVKIADPTTDELMKATFKVRAGMKFKEWNTDPKGNGKTYKAGDSFTYTNKDVTLYAQWEKPMIKAMPETGGLGGYQYPASGFLVLITGLSICILRRRGRR